MQPPLLASIAIALRAVSAHAVGGVDCDLQRLMPLLSDSDLTACAVASGLTLPPTAALTVQQLIVLCGIPECVVLINKVSALNLGDCTMGTTRLDSDLLMPAREVCANTLIELPVTESSFFRSGSGRSMNLTNGSSDDSTLYPEVAAFPVSSVTTTVQHVAATTAAATIAVLSGP